MLFRCVTKKAIGETKQGFIAKWLISSLSIRNSFVSPFVSAYMCTVLGVKGQGLSLKQGWVSKACSG